MSKNTPRIIKTYMPFTLPLDPANVKTLVDLDLSYALGATLVDWNSRRELSAGLAEAWEITGQNEISFILRAGAAWSDNSPLSAAQVVASFKRAKREHGDSLKSLFDLVSSFHAKDTRTVVFDLTMPVTKSGFLRKLTEPMYGVVYIKDDGSLDLTKTAGPFTATFVSQDKIILTANKNWHDLKPDMAEQVEIRRHPANQDMQNIFAKDSWVNLVGSSSLISQSLSDQYDKNNYAVWHRTLDKIFFFSPGPRITNADGRQLFRFLNENLDRNLLTQNLNGFTLTDQFFPPGYVLFDPSFSKPNTKIAIPEQFATRPIEILGADVRLGEILQANIKTAIKAVIGIEPKFKIVPLSEFEQSRVAGNYDFVAGTLPVNDPNVEGAMGFLFGLTPPIIPNAGDGTKNFKLRIDNAAKLETQLERNIEYRKVFSEATQEGCLLPLFHFSSVVIAKDGIDLSAVPTTDETVAFSKVRFK